MSYLDITDRDILEMDDEVLECGIRSEMNSYINHRYQDVRRDNLIKLLAESKKRSLSMAKVGTKNIGHKSGVIERGVWMYGVEV